MKAHANLFLSIPVYVPFLEAATKAYEGNAGLRDCTLLTSTNSLTFVYLNHLDRWLNKFLSKYLFCFFITLFCKFLFREFVNALSSQQ